MKAHEFMRRRARLAQEHRPAWWMRKAFDKLLREAGAVPQIAAKRVVAYRLSSGEIVCNKQRFKNEDAAGETLTMIQNEHQHRPREPVRAYYCGHCKGWHITSMDKNGQ